MEGRVFHRVFVHSSAPVSVFGMTVVLRSKVGNGGGGEDKDVSREGHRPVLDSHTHGSG